MRRAGAAILGLVLVLALVACSDLAGSADRREERREQRAEQRAEKEREKEREKGREKGRDKGFEQRAEPTYLVTWVVDGDTLELGNGERVRLLGIDTPEVGECGYEKARDRLVALVEGERVTLGEGDVDRDRYDRLLRYVDLGPLDAGLRLLKDGLAIARYDSRDGYGFHPREPAYIKADRGAPNLTCAPAPRRFAPQQPSGCAPGYSPCVPVYPPDVDCADVDGPISVTGSDPHGLDADGDHVACEWG